MKIVKYSALCLAILGCSYSPAVNAQTPEITQNKVVYGAKSLEMDGKGHFTLKTSGSRIFKDSYYLKADGIKGIEMDGKTVVFDKTFNYNEGEKKFTYTCKFPLGNENNIGTFSRTVKLVADNLLQVNIKITIPKGIKVSYQHMTLMFPFTVCDGKTVVVNEKPKKFFDSNNPDNGGSSKIFSGVIKSLSFTPGEASSSFKMNMKTRNYGSIKERRGGQRAMSVIRISPDANGEVSLLLDLRSN
jgi:hypothetical protein